MASRGEGKPRMKRSTSPDPAEDPFRVRWERDVAYQETVQPPGSRVQALRFPADASSSSYATLETITIANRSGEYSIGVRDVDDPSRRVLDQSHRTYFVLHDEADKTCNGLWQIFHAGDADSKVNPYVSGRGDAYMTKSNVVVTDHDPPCQPVFVDLPRGWVECPGLQAYISGVEEHSNIPVRRPDRDPKEHIDPIRTHDPVGHLESGSSSLSRIDPAQTAARNTLTMTPTAPASDTGTSRHGEEEMPSAATSETNRAPRGARRRRNSETRTARQPAAGGRVSRRLPAEQAQSLLSATEDVQTSQQQSTSPTSSRGTRGRIRPQPVTRTPEEQAAMEERRRVRLDRRAWVQKEKDAISAYNDMKSGRRPLPPDGEPRPGFPQVIPSDFVASEGCIVLTEAQHSHPSVAFLAATLGMTLAELNERRRQTNAYETRVHESARVHQYRTSEGS